MGGYCRPRVTRGLRQGADITCPIVMTKSEALDLVLLDKYIALTGPIWTLQSDMSSIESHSRLPLYFTLKHVSRPAHLPLLLRLFFTHYSTSRTHSPTPLLSRTTYDLLSDLMMAGSSSTRVRKGRLGSSIKSNNGCSTCKIRRVKCDEEEPVCRRCSSTGRKCDGYPSNTNSHVQRARSHTDYLAHVAHVSRYNDLDHVELQSFEYFIWRVVPGFSGIVDRHFWRQVLPQLCHSSKIIWDAVNALACLIRYPQLSPQRLLPGRQKSAVTDTHHRRALRWYSRSLHGLQERMREGSLSASVLVVTCILYACVELLQDNIDESVALYWKALAMNATLAVADVSNKSTLAVHRDTTLEHSTQALLRHMSVAQPSPTMWVNDFCHFHTDFENLSQARDAGYAMAAEAHMFIVQIQEIKLKAAKDWLPEESHIHRRDELKSKLFLWEAALQKLMATWPKRISEYPDEDELYSTLMLSWTQYTIEIATSLSMYATSYDDFFPDFRKMLEYIRRVIAVQKSKSPRPVFVLETRILPALHYVAVKCRHPIIRRQAISLTENDAPRMEYYFKAVHTAEEAKRIIGIEEADGSELGVFETERVPEEIDVLPAEEHRIYRELLSEVPDPSSTQPIQYLTYGMWRRWGENGAWIPTEHVIRL